MQTWGHLICWEVQHRSPSWTLFIPNNFPNFTLHKSLLDQLVMTNVETGVIIMLGGKVADTPTIQSQERRECSSYFTLFGISRRFNDFIRFQTLINSFQFNNQSLCKIWHLRRGIEKVSSSKKLKRTLLLLLNLITFQALGQFYLVC